MDINEFFKEGNKVLTEDEWKVVAGAYDKAENDYNDLLDNLREAVKGVMAKLWEKRNCTELTTDRFTIINRFGDIGVIDRRVDSTDETSLDDIENVDTMMDIVSNFV
jgi:hypothetical protein